MYFRLIAGQAEVYSAAQLRKDNPNTSFPKLLSDELLAEWGVYPVQVGVKPTIDPRYQRIVQSDMIEENGVVTRGWVIEEIPGTIERVKTEAYRRIIAICPEWKQRNLTAQAAQLAKKGEANWTPEESAAWAAGEALWSQIAVIRDKSNAIENMDQIPVDYCLDVYWE